MDSYAPANFADVTASVQGRNYMLGFQSEGQSKSLAGYTMIPDKFYPNKPCRNALGLVGGNDVSVVNAPMVDVESDLYGITRPNTWCTDRKHLPPSVKDTEIQRSNPKTELKINVAPRHMPVYQMWAYPATVAPLPFESKVCKNPEKY